MELLESQVNQFQSFNISIKLTFNSSVIYPEIYLNITWSDTLKFLR